MHRIPCVLLCAAAFAAHAAADTAQGFVFEDLNGNAARDAGEPGVPGVSVSNGIDVVQTDDNGAYTLPVTDDTILFVIKPAGWQVPIAPRTNLPKHYYIHKPNGSPSGKHAGVAPTGPLPDSVDFALRRQEEPDAFRMLLFGDTQPRNQQEVDYISHDIIEEVAGMDAAFGATLGDLVFDDLNVMEPMLQSVGLVGMPWHHVIGNHDINQDTLSVAHQDETYERHFGPSYYAFNHAKTHFIALNDIWWEVGRRSYHAELGEAQLKFIENNLRFVPKDRLIILMMHIPIMEIVDKARLFELLKDYPHTLSLSAHWHHQAHFFLGGEVHWQRPEKHHHLVSATACGAWWTGEIDETGIPHATMVDGGPNGYSVIDFDGVGYAITFKAARRPADYQMNIYAPEVVASDQSASTEIIVNVFAGSERSTVEMRYGNEGPWIALENFTAQDPGYLRNRQRDADIAAYIAKEAGHAELTDALQKRILGDLQGIRGRAHSTAKETNHLWRGKLPAKLPKGYDFIHVRTTDMFGQTHTGRRVLRVE